MFKIIIAFSNYRKIIAEESAKIMKLKEEATKLSQKYKIVATELRNINTAITLNKKEQRSVHNRLSKIRIQHQRLLQRLVMNHNFIFRIISKIFSICNDLYQTGSFSIY